MLKSIRMVLLSTGLAMASGIASAGEQTLECRLYIAESLDHANTYPVESSGSVLNGCWPVWEVAARVCRSPRSTATASLSG